jgi:REP element-mobilizing transposase RayT
MCRGNQSRNIFILQDDVDLFIETLGQMCERNDVIVHAWCAMSNHYHLLLETPQGNLVDAMKWFQGTFTQRYNARHKLRGHLYQGRYKAKVIEQSDASYFRKVSEYIHLNPANAGLAKPGRLEEYTWSSYPQYLQSISRRPGWLAVEDVLGASGLPGDSRTSRRAYKEMMDSLHRDLVERKAEGKTDREWRRMDRGWMHGGEEFREWLLDRLTNEGRMEMAEEREQKRDLSERAARKVLLQCLEFFQLSESDLSSLAKGDERKLLIAGLLRANYPVRAQWVSDELRMGHFTTVSRGVRFYREAKGPWSQKKKQILKFIG